MWMMWGVFAEESGQSFANFAKVLSKYASVSGYRINETKSILMGMYTMGLEGERD